MHPSKRPGSILLLLAGLILLLLMIGIAVVPVVHCRSCEIEIAVREAEAQDPPGTPAPIHECSHCNGTGRVTLLKQWLVPCEYERVQ